MQRRAAVGRHDSAPSLRWVGRRRVAIETGFPLTGDGQQRCRLDSDLFARRRAAKPEVSRSEGFAVRSLKRDRKVQITRGTDLANICRLDNPLRAAAASEFERSETSRRANRERPGRYRWCPSPRPVLKELARGWLTGPNFRLRNTSARLQVGTQSTPVSRDGPPPMRISAWLAVCVPPMAACARTAWGDVSIS